MDVDLDCPRLARRASALRCDEALVALPECGVVHRVARHEGHLSRELAQTLALLHHLQAACRGRRTRPRVVGFVPAESGLPPADPR